MKEMSGDIYSMFQCACANKHMCEYYTLRILDEICAYCEILCMNNVSLYSIKYVLCICYVYIMYISYTCVSRIYVYIVDIMYTLHILFCIIVHTKETF